MSSFTLVYFRGCPNTDKARKLLASAGVKTFHEIVQDELADKDPLKTLSSPSILGRDGQLILGERCSQPSGACTFSLSDDEAMVRLKNALNREKTSLKSVLSPLLGTGSSLGFLALIGACGGTCSLLAIPVTGFLASIGLGVIAPWLSMLRYPLLGLSALFAALSLVRIYRTGRKLGSVLAGIFLLSLITTSFIASQRSDCSEKIQGTAKYLQSLSPETQEVVKTGIYRTWIRLGRAPTLEEIQTALGPESAVKVEKAIRELKASEFAEMFIPGTNTIRWFWPLSMQNHGVEVTLAGEKAVFARCAVDALGMSKMFGKPSTITMVTSLWKKRIEFSMNGVTLAKFDHRVVVSKGDGCDDLLFFSSAEEFSRFKEKTGRTQLKMMPLSDAVQWGLASFGSIFEG